MHWNSWKTALLLLSKRVLLFLLRHKNIPLRVGVVIARIKPSWQYLSRTQLLTTVSLSHGHGHAVFSQGTTVLSHQVPWTDSQRLQCQCGRFKSGIKYLCWFDPTVQCFQRERSCSVLTGFLFLNIELFKSQDVGFINSSQGLARALVPAIICHYSYSWSYALKDPSVSELQLLLVDGEGLYY